MSSAWADESASADLYMLGAVVIRDDLVSEIRASAERLRPSKGVKAHWHGSSVRDRDKMIAVLASLPVASLVVVRLAQAPEHTERQRRKCMELLLPTLVGVTDLTLELRGGKDDQRDREMLAGLRRSKAIGGALRMHHSNGPNDPLLWLADILCGAASTARRGEARWWDSLRDSTAVLTFEASQAWFLNR
jgi:hypothetical protein